MVTSKEILDWVVAHVMYRKEKGFPGKFAEVNEQTLKIYSLGLYEGYYSALIDSGAEVENPDESSHEIKEM